MRKLKKIKLNNIFLNIFSTWHYGHWYLFIKSWISDWLKTKLHWKLNNYTSSKASFSALSSFFLLSNPMILIRYMPTLINLWGGQHRSTDTYSQALLKATILANINLVLSQHISPITYIQVFWLSAMSMWMLVNVSYFDSYTQDGMLHI